MTERARRGFPAEFLGTLFATRGKIVVIARRFKMNNAKATKFTVGDLVVAATDAAFEVSGDEKRAYQLAGLVVNLILRSQKSMDSHSDGWNKETFH